MVVAIHASGPVAASWGPGAGLATTVAAVIDQLCRTCVPIFVLLSGHALMARRLARPDEAVLPYLRGRLLRGVPPLVLWGVVGLAWAGWKPDLGWTGWPEAAVIRVLTADYHLYFLPAILGLWLLVPVIAFLGPGRLLPLLALWQVALCQPTQTWWPPLIDLQTGIPAWSPLRWMPWFVLGMWTATRPVGAAGLWAPLATVAGLTWAVAEVLTARGLGAVADHVNHFSRLSVTVASLGLWSWWRAADAPLLGWAGARPWVARWSARTFGIFLVHPSVLRLLDLGLGPDAADPFLRIGVALLASAALVAAIDRILPWGRAGLGLEPRRLA
jgi:surface polysaccharide O-acyltransferase-like enzyme